MKFIKINGIKLPPDHKKSDIIYAAAKLGRLDREKICEMKIIRRSIDARKNRVMVNYSVALGIKDHVKIHRSAVIYEEKEAPQVVCGSKPIENRPIIIGSGPAGIFAALELALYGYKPIVLERGSDVDTRGMKVANFFQNMILDTESNIQFGEGGAGTYSDGKLMSRNNSPERRAIYDALIEGGANPEITYESHPHIGTDVLIRVVKSLRKKIESLGGKYIFDCRVDDLIMVDGHVKGVICNGGQKILSSRVIMATGHSAGALYRSIHNSGVLMINMPFAVGLRIEHKKETIDRAQYGEFAGNPALGASPYSLSHRSEDRNVHTFCMCPGGVVVNAASNFDSLCVNGMSYSKRDGDNSNSAIVCRVNEKDYGSGIFAGIDYQKKLEKLAFNAGGDYSVPVQRLGDFLDNKTSTSIGDIIPSVETGYNFANLRWMLGEELSGSIGDAINAFGRRISGFDFEDAMLSGLETRTSSPIRIIRDKSGESNILGLFPTGEGAGYAGGILSSAVDGLRTARIIISRFAPATLD